MRYPALFALLLLVQVGCGRDPVPPSPDMGSPSTDAGMEDAGSEAVDSGTSPGDGGTTPPGDGGTQSGDAGTPMSCPGNGAMQAIPTALGDARLVADASADILDRLRAIRGLTVQENPTGGRVPAGYRFFLMQYTQPADHARPECQTFTQRLTLLHTSDTAPMVLYTGGYFLSPTSTSRRELTVQLGANQLTVEHRFFPPSIPEPADWSLLTIQQSASDFHRIVQAFKPIYGGRWLSTGASKGGETVVFFRRFYPQDVDGTVAYVAPIARADDERFPAFQDAVGGAAQAACRARLHAFQRTVLERRTEMVGLLRAYAEAKGLTYSQLGFEQSLEHAVIETYFAFWQYDSPENCDLFPGSEATSQQLLDKMDEQTGLGTFADRGSLGVGTYAAYYHQASVELGWPRPYETPLGGLLLFPGTDTAPVYAPLGVPHVFREQAMRDVQDWVSSQGERLMFIYGGLDPWSAAAYSLGDAKDSFLYQVPGGNHGSSLGQLPEPQRTQALETVRRWAGVTGLRRVPLLARPQFEEFAPHLPPRLRSAGVP